MSFFKKIPLWSQSFFLILLLSFQSSINAIPGPSKKAFCIRVRYNRDEQANHGPLGLSPAMVDFPRHVGRQEILNHPDALEEAARQEAIQELCDECTTAGLAVSSPFSTPPSNISSMTPGVFLATVFARRANRAILNNPELLPTRLQAAYDDYLNRHP